MTDTMADYLIDDMYLAPMMPHDIGTSRDELIPCAEFLKFRELLDKAGIKWHDASDTELLPRWGMYRTHGDGFSCIYGTGSYGMERGLLELQCSNMVDVEGHLTAHEAFDLCAEKLGWTNENS